MSIDPQRLTRVRAHLLGAAALLTAGCNAASSTPEHTINAPATVNTAQAPTPTAAVAGSSTPESAGDGPIHVNPPPTLETAAPTPDHTASALASASAAPAPSAKQVVKPTVLPPRTPPHINTPVHINRPADDGQRPR